MREFVSKFLTGISDLFTVVLIPFLVIAGAGLLSYGAYLIYAPAAFIVGGLLLLAAAWDASS